MSHLQAEARKVFACPAVAYASFAVLVKYDSILRRVLVEHRYSNCAVHHPPDGRQVGDARSSDVVGARIMAPAGTSVRD